MAIKKITLITRTRILKEVGDGMKSVGGIIIAACAVGVFFSGQFPVWGGVIGLLAGVALQLAGVYLKVVLESEEAKMREEGES